MTNEKVRRFVLIKKDQFGNDQYYIFQYSLGDEQQLVRILADMANNPTCALDRFDVSTLSFLIGESAAESMQKILNP